MDEGRLITGFIFDNSRAHYLVHSGGCCSDRQKAKTVDVSQPNSRGKRSPERPTSTARRLSSRPVTDSSSTTLPSGRSLSNGLFSCLLLKWSSGLPATQIEIGLTVSSRPNWGNFTEHYICQVWIDLTVCSKLSVVSTSTLASSGWRLRGQYPVHLMTSPGMGFPAESPCISCTVLYLESDSCPCATQSRLFSGTFRIDALKSEPSELPSDPLLTTQQDSNVRLRLLIRERLARGDEIRNNQRPGRIFFDGFQPS
ncbi:hypothetical protein CROQUDRAFT_100782 [Cronartium quercuum f. sp. fusiforme G11]|uniref:Uncharacterized protein n=1 Tax=Cronartium quercuum f. sp. fusiforme G11 TaxID=708437 RepID=A0A9P6N6F7_9BASI|nr:hypothetical protein CROQUDRAFT_100782 [Cronartium quercuum f. sp. fusiforme G11]